MHPYRDSPYPIAVYAWVDPTDPEFILKTDVFSWMVPTDPKRWPREVFNSTFVPLHDWRWHTTGFLSPYLPRKPDGSYWAPSPVKMWSSEAGEG